MDLFSKDKASSILNFIWLFLLNDGESIQIAKRRLFVSLTSTKKTDFIIMRNELLVY